MTTIAEDLAAGTLPDRVWFYSNYHCNLTCTYCFTESSPSTPKMAMPPEQILELALIGGTIAERVSLDAPRADRGEGRGYGPVHRRFHADGLQSPCDLRVERCVLWKRRKGARLG